MVQHIWTLGTTLDNQISECIMKNEQGMSALLSNDILTGHAGTPKSIGQESRNATINRSKKTAFQRNNYLLETFWVKNLAGSKYYIFVVITINSMWDVLYSISTHALDLCYTITPNQCDTQSWSRRRNEITPDWRVMIYNIHSS